MNPSGELARLRYRENGVERPFTHVMTLMGHIVGVSEDVVHLHQGRERVTALLIEDIEETLGGVDMCRALLIDAGKHQDVVKIGLEHDRVSYDNAAQQQRYEKLAAEQG